MTVPLARDTSPDIEAIQIDRWRRMSPAEKAALITGLTGAAFEMARAGVRHRYPGASAREHHLRLAVVLWGEAFARQVYPDLAILDEP